MSLLLSAPLLFSLLGTSAPGAVVHRCSEPDGSLVFTDRTCVSLGMSDRLPPPSSATASRRSSGGPNRMFTTTCARSPDGLRRHLSDALYARDVNALLGLIDWQGTSGGGARATTRRMQGIAKRESVEVSLESDFVDTWQQRELSGVASEEAYASLAPPPPPTSLRVEQRSAGGTLESVHFGLTRDQGCYWLRL